MCSWKCLFIGKKNKAKAKSCPFRDFRIIKTRLLSKPTSLPLVLLFIRAKKKEFFVRYFILKIFRTKY